MSSMIEQSYNDILYRVATPDDRDDVLDFIRKHYYPEEPLTTGCEPKVQDPEDEEFSVSVIPHGTTIIAYVPSQNDRMVGVVLSGPIGPNEAAEMIEEAERCESKSKKWAIILRLLAYLSENAKIYERFNVSKALHIYVLGVDRQMRGKSIGAQLIRKCFEVAKSLGYPIVSADFSSAFSIKIAEQLEMNCVFELAYIDYKDENGKQILQPPQPHTHVKTFVKCL